MLVTEHEKFGTCPMWPNIALPKQLPFANKSETFEKMWFHLNTRAVKPASAKG